MGGGLEIQMPGGKWRAVPSPLGTLTINIGVRMPGYMPR